MNEELFNSEMADMLGEVERRFASGGLCAFSIVMVNPDGSFRHLSAYREGFGLPLFAATDIAHAEIRSDRMNWQGPSRITD